MPNTTIDFNRKFGRNDEYVDPIDFPTYIIKKSDSVCFKMFIAALGWYFPFDCKTKLVKIAPILKDISIYFDFLEKNDNSTPEFMRDAAMFFAEYIKLSLKYKNSKAIHAPGNKISKDIKTICAFIDFVDKKTSIPLIRLNEIFDFEDKKAQKEITKWSMFYEGLWDLLNELRFLRDNQNRSDKFFEIINQDAYLKTRPSIQKVTQVFQKMNRHYKLKADANIDYLISGLIEAKDEIIKILSTSK